MKVKVKMRTSKKAVSKRKYRIDLRARAFRALPDRIKCPHCTAVQAKAEYGVRVVKRDGRGMPLKVVRQSWCQTCRNTQQGGAKKVARKPVAAIAPTAPAPPMKYVAVETEPHLYSFSTKNALQHWLAGKPGRTPVQIEVGNAMH